MLLALLLVTLAHAETRDLNATSSGWTELPHSGGDLTIEPARPKPKVEPQAAPPPAPELESMQGLPPEDRELFEAQLKRRQALGALNSTNPMSEGFQLNAIQAKLPRQLAAFAARPEVLSDFQKILSTPIHSPWIAIEIAWVVFFFILRAWRLSRAKSVGRRLFEHAWLGCAFVLGVFLFIPWLVYGKPYVRLLSGAAAALFS